MDDNQHCQWHGFHQNFEGGTLSRLDFDGDYYSVRAVLNRQWPTWRRDLLVVALAAPMVIGVIAFWEGWLFP